MGNSHEARNCPADGWSLEVLREK